MQRFKRYKEVNVKTGCRHVAKWVFPVPRSRQAIANEAQAAQFPSIQLRSQMDLLIPLECSWFRKRRLVEQARHLCLFPQCQLLAYEGLYEIFYVTEIKQCQFNDGKDDLYYFYRLITEINMFPTVRQLIKAIHL